jgi:UBX domain-containing protein 1
MEVAEPAEDIPAPQGEEGAAAAAGTAGVGAARQAAGRINLNRRINLTARGDSDTSEDEEEGQAFYAGGSTSSGNVILGPGKKKKDIVGNLFKAAREAGAEEVAETSGSTASTTRVKAFTGGGFKLGSENQPSEAVGQPSGPPEAEPRKFVLKMWQNGFSVDDGELREYTNPESREFLAAVMRGSIPAELIREARGGEVHVDMEDHRNEEYVKPKAVRKAFQGTGQVLGSIAPQVVPPTPTSAVNPAQAETMAKQKVGLDESQPASNIEVRMADGSRLIARLNHTHTLADLRTYITTAR